MSIHNLQVYRRAWSTHANPRPLPLSTSLLPHDKAITGITIAATGVKVLTQVSGSSLSARFANIYKFI